MRSRSIPLMLCLLYCVTAAAEAPLASGKLVLAKGLGVKAKGIRALFLSIRDAKSPMPMPYGAQKLTLEKDAEGEFLRFQLDPSSIMVMGGGDAPALMDLKAKLSKSGSAGPDRPGDIVGTLKGIRKGAKDLTIVLDKAVE